MSDCQFNFDRYTNCLRVQVYPDQRFDEHVGDIRQYCLKNDIGDVIMFMLAEAYFDGHSTKEDFRPWVESIKKAKKVFNDAGITLSLNPWIEIGHSDRGRTLKAGQNFTTMIDMDGKQASMMVCPYDENWRKYFAEVQAYYTGEIQPAVLWIEDDLRLHNHSPLNYGGCYCATHMKKFNEKLGTSYDRVEFLQRAFAQGNATVERKAWLDVNRDTITSAAEFMGENIAQASPQTEVGLMSSSVVAHTLEARDWHGVHAGLSQGKRIIDRIHLPSYSETVPAYYYRSFNTTSTVVRRMLPDDANIYPEIESGDFNIYVRDPEFLRFQIESAIPLAVSGMTLNILDVVGNGAFDPAGYGDVIKEITPYMRAVSDLKIRYSAMEGVLVPFDPDCAYKRRIRKHGWQDMYPNHLDFAGYICGLGASYKISLDKNIQGEFICLIGGSTDDFSDDELRNLFENNFILLDAGAVERLFERKLNSLIEAESMEKIITDRGVVAYEQAGEWLKIDGHHGLKVSCEGGINSTGDYLNIQYSREVNALSEVYDKHGARVGIGSVLEDRFAVVPYNLEFAAYEHYNAVRRSILHRMIEERANTFILSESSCVYPYLYRENNRSVVILVNTLLKDMHRIRLHIKGVDFCSIKKLDKTGEQRFVNFVYEDGVLTIDEPIPHLSTVTMILQ